MHMSDNILCVYVHVGHVQMALFFKNFPGGAKHLFVPEYHLESIDFINPVRVWGWAPKATPPRPVYASHVGYL